MFESTDLCSPEDRARYMEAVRAYYSDPHRPYLSSLGSDVEIRGRRTGAIGLESALALVRAAPRGVIYGKVATGKTTLLDRYAREMSEIPNALIIVAPLYRLVTTLWELLDHEVQRFVPAVTVSSLIEGATDPQRLVLLLDGLDGIAPPVQERFRAQLGEFLARHSTAQVIITGRLDPEKGASLLPDLSWEWIELPTVSVAEALAVMTAAGGPKVAESFRNRPDLLELATRPLFLYTMRDAILAGIELRPYFFRATRAYMLWRGHARSDLPHSLTPSSIEAAFKLIAMEMVRRRLAWIERREIEGLLLARGIPNGETLIAALAATDPIDVSGDRVRFRHASYLESYCAQYLLAQLPGRISDRDLKAVIDSPHRRAILEDLFGLATGEQRTLLLRLAPPSMLTDMVGAAPAEAALVDSRQGQDVVHEIVATFEGASRQEPRLKRRDVLVFAVHGFNTRGDWKNRLSPILNLETDGVRYIYLPWDYGNFWLGILNPWAHRAKVQEFAARYNEEIASYGATGNHPAICVVAHSFGTKIVGDAIKTMEGVSFDRVILLRSVLPRRFPWAAVRDKCGSVLSEVGGSDQALLAAALVPGLGASGRFGFKEPPDFVRESISPYGTHSSMFGTKHMREVWIPFFRTAAGD